ncbi:MAG: FAD-dependent oxidoreductase [Caulobacteraceae bacterium]
MTTRRQLIHRVGALGGILAAYSVMREVGLLGPDTAQAGPLNLAAGSGRGTKVLILGGGLSGLASAYELGKAGYDCTILEARTRVGGRNWTVRGGDKIEQTDGTVQTVGFDQGLYLNAGCARIPSHHQLTLGYCREFGVAMETVVNATRSGRIQSDALFGGQPIQLRQAIYDTRGFVSELLAKAVKKGALDQEVSAEDKARLLEMLRGYGGLKADDLTYRGSTSAGFANYPGAGDEWGTARDPISMQALLDRRVWGRMIFEDDVDMQTTMLQPVGGMDHIPKAFEARLPGVIKQGAEVRKIARTASGVQVTYFDKSANRLRVLDANLLICTIPLPVLAKIENDFAPAYKSAIQNAVYGDAVKVAFQSERFWEHKDQVYGGLSFTDRETSVVWYPSGNYGASQGIILGAYNWDNQASTFARRSIAKQIEYARTSIDKMHPGNGGLLGRGMSVHWQKIPYNLGPWANFNEEPSPIYDLLSQPDGPFYFAGEHLSHVGAWQQGAFASAHRTVGMIDARVRAGRPVTETRAQ